MGIKPDLRTRIQHQPTETAALFARVEATQDNANLDIVVGFYVEQEELGIELPALINSLTKSGSLWICWPKKSSGVMTSITEDTLRTLILPLGLVDNKVCAVDSVWSALRFVWRKERR